jgi:hypothetical protein
MLKIFKKTFFSKKLFLVKENEESLGTFYLSKWNFQNEINYSARDPTYLAIQLSHMCTTSQGTYLVSENVNWAEPKIVPFEACKGCC